MHAGAASYKNSDGCLAWVNTGGCIWTPDSPDPEACFVCEAKAVSVGAIKQIDALAEASAPPQSCATCFYVFLRALFVTLDLSCDTCSRKLLDTS